MKTAEDVAEEKKYSLVYMKGVEGNSIYLNDFRIAGPKPWGGGTILKEWHVTVKDLAYAIPEIAKALKIKSPYARQ